MKAYYEMKKDERQLWLALSSPQLGEEIDSEVRRRVMTGLERGIFAAVRAWHEWKTLVQEWKKSDKPTEWLAVQLDGLAVQLSLYRGVEFGAIGALRSISEEKLKLVCYELIVQPLDGESRPSPSDRGLTRPP